MINYFLVENDPPEKTKLEAAIMYTYFDVATVIKRFRKIYNNSQRTGFSYFARKLIALNKLNSECLLSFAGSV